MKPIKIFVSALEYSANLHLANLLAVFKQKNIPFTLCGIFDMQVVPDFKSNFEPSIFRVMGFVGILKLIPRFLRAKHQLANIATNCDIALFMDSSSFNIPLIQTIRKNPKTPHIIYYILPQVWAWKPKRAQVLSEICDELWGILPFENDFYPANTPLSYVGHPLLDAIPYTLTTQQESDKIAFMPGSRKSEIQALLPTFKALAIRLKNEGKTPILIVPKSFKTRNLNAIYGDTSVFTLHFDTYDALRECTFAFVCSGTATLESTLLGIPTILAYKARALDYYIAKALVRLNFIGLANIFLEFSTFGAPKHNPNPNIPLIHPEFLQDAVCEDTLYQAYKDYDYARFFNQKQKLLEYLKCGSAESCAQNLENLIKNLQK